MTSDIIYLGPAGAGLGFRLSGIDVDEVASSAELLHRIKDYHQKQSYRLIFVDEILAEEIAEAINTLNQSPIPTIVMLPNPAQARHLASQKLQQLMIKAVGSDIFNK